MSNQKNADDLRTQVQALTQRVHRLETWVYPAPPPPGPQSAAAPFFTQPSTAGAGPTVATPPLLPGGRRQPALRITPSRLLAIVGGLVLLLGTGFLLRYAVAQGWLGPQVRVLLALVGSAVLAGIGLRLERTGTTRVVGQICVATAAAAAFAAVVAAAVVYELVAPAAGLVAAGGVAAAAALHGAASRQQGVAALGIGGALVAPVLVRAGDGALTLGLLLIALVLGAAVAVRRTWPLVTALCFGLVTPQLWSMGLDQAPVATALVFTALCASVLLMAGVANAGRCDWRDAVVALIVVGFNAAAAAGLGYLVLSERLAAAGPRPGLWLCAVAGVHLIAGFAAARRLLGPSVAVVLILAGVVLADLAFLELLDGYAVQAALTLVAVVAAGAVRVPWLTIAARTALVLQLVLAALHGLDPVVKQAPLGSAEAVLVVAVLCALAVLFTTITPTAHRDLAIVGAAIFSGLGVARLLLFEAPLESLLNGPADLAVALVMCVLLVATGLLLAELVHRRFMIAAVAVANFGVSLAAVAMDPEGAGRVALTGLWAVAGGFALVGGRRLGRADIRRGGAALLVAAVAKAAIVDTTTLDGTARAVALLLCGSVLVATAIVEARAAGAIDAEINEDGPVPTP
jgi:uncharacterized membrane protein